MKELITKICECLRIIADFIAESDRNLIVTLLALLLFAIIIEKIPFWAILIIAGFIVWWFNK